MNDQNVFHEESLEALLVVIENRVKTIVEKCNMVRSVATGGQELASCVNGEGEQTDQVSADIFATIIYMLQDGSASFELLDAISSLRASVSGSSRVAVLA